jgi:CopG family nickel-responsive transcriptional regulator
MAGVVRFGVSMEAPLSARFDQLVAARGYPNRSEAVRDMVRRELVRQAWQDPDAPTVGTVTLVYDHHVRDLGERLVSLQHDHHDLVVSATHVHLTHHNCLEVLVVRGPARAVRELADQLIAAKGVLHGELVATTTGEVFQEPPRRRRHGHRH